uniref:Ig-like domain-containing protein n=1 Tax=Amphimedon queenslandica TaxID=400682 RepID=A0A1X7VVI6_AMPQE
MVAGGAWISPSFVFVLVSFCFWFCFVSTFTTTLDSEKDFQGFGDTDNTTVIVRLGQAVALLCNVTQRPVPTIVWYKNDTIIEPDTVDDTNPKYILLDDGQHLVIYNLVNDDITATYKCGVINVVNPQNSSNNYTLYKVNTIPGGMNAFIAYRRPVTNQFVSSQDSTISYFYIAATNGATEVGGSGAITPTMQDGNLLRIRFTNTLASTPGLNVILDRDSINVDTSVTVGYTVVEPLSVVEFPSVKNASSFRYYELENINFTCRANGTDVKLRWYFNGLQLTNNNETLILNDLSPARTGVYQCLWEGFFDNERESVSWALSVQIIDILGPVHSIQSSVYNCSTVNITWNSQNGVINSPNVFYRLKIYDDVTGSLIDAVSVYDTNYQFVDNDLFTHRYTYVINEATPIKEGISDNNTFSYQRVPTSATVNTSIDVLSYTQDMIIVQFQIPIVLECAHEVLEHVTVSVICSGTDVYSNVTYFIKDMNNIKGLVLVPQYQQCNISIAFTNDVGSSEPFIVPLNTIIMYATTTNTVPTTSSFPTATPSFTMNSNSVTVASAVTMSLLSAVIISLIICLTISVIYIIYKKKAY